jgi:uncharacterized protein YggU (UPF0235/DUF167 family)
MRITIVAKPKKKREFVEQVSPTHYVVSVKEPPVDGRANDAIIKALAGFFSLPRSSIILVSGHTAKVKIFEVPDSLADFEVLPKQKSLL